MSELDKDKLKYVAGGQSGYRPPDIQWPAKTHEEIELVRKAEHPDINRDDKDGWKAWWDWRRKWPFFAVVGRCERCRGYCGTNGSLCKECREWVNS